MFNLGPLIGHIIGTVIVPPMSDSWIVRRARGNDGIYEPEMRLWFALGAGVFVIAGVSLFGIGISEVVALACCLSRRIADLSVVESSIADPYYGLWALFIRVWHLP